MDHRSLTSTDGERAGQSLVGSISSPGADWLKFGQKLKPELQNVFMKWGATGIALGIEETSAPRRRGEWYLAGRQMFSHGFLTALLGSDEWKAAGGCALKTAKNNASVCRKFQMSWHQDLSYEHHAAVRKLPDALAHQMLHKAKALGWTDAWLKVEVKRFENGYYEKSSGDIVSSLQDLITKNKKYDSICVDPPWEFDDGTKPNGGAGRHYMVMSVENISALRVPEVCTPATTLYLWVPEVLRDQGIAVIKAWGFEDAGTPFIWYKIDRSKPNNDLRGVGSRPRCVHELLLVGLHRTSPRTWDVSHPSIIEHPRMRGHSRKPDIFYQIIEEVTGGKCLEMFGRGRKRRPNWDVVGDQVED